MTKKTQDIIIIGAGIIGCSIAWELSQRGMNVIILDERDKPFQGSSKAGFGSLTPYSDPIFKGEARDYAAKGVELYRNSWISRVESESNLKIPFNNDGLIELGQNNSKLEQLKKHADDLIKEGASQLCTRYKCLGCFL